MATLTKTLKDGTQCIRVTVRDEENEVLVHWHKGEVPMWGDGNPQRGLLVQSAALGVICSVGEVRGECA